MKPKICLVLLFVSSYSWLAAQCFEPDADIWLNTWSSCEMKMNPIEGYGENHWIQYDFGVVRKLSKTWIWNTNDPTKLDQGFKLVKIDYSEDGLTWTNWGKMEFPMAQGDAIYSGFAGPDLVGMEARFVLITAISNHGHPTCAGLAEVKFNLLPQVVEGSLSTCSAPLAFTKVGVEDIEQQNALVFWDSDLEDLFGFLFLYRKQGQESEEWAEIETDEYEVFLENLQPGTTYEYIVITECEEEAVYTDIKSFTTLSEDQTTRTSDHQGSQNKLKLFPNPTPSSFTLWYSSEINDQLHFAVVNLQGQSIMEGIQHVNAGANTIQINLSEFPDGLYFVETMPQKQQWPLKGKMVKVQR